MAKELSEINMEQVAGLAEHNVVIVTIAYSQDVSCHAVAGKRQREIFFRLLKNRIAELDLFIFSH